MLLTFNSIEFYSKLIANLEFIIDNRISALANRLSFANQQIEIKIQIQSPDSNFKILICTTEKYVLNTEGNDKVIEAINTRSSFNPERFKQEFFRIVHDKIQQCIFGSFPVEFSFLVKPDNKVCGSVTSHFIVD